MDGCIFCSVAEGKMPADIFYDDGHFIAFLDIRPHAKGHSLLVPKQHSTSLLEASSETQQLLGEACARIATLIRDTLEAPALNIISNVGAEAGQIIFHTHIHFIPRYDHSHSKTYTYAEGERDGILAKLRAASGYTTNSRD